MRLLKRGVGGVDLQRAIEHLRGPRRLTALHQDLSEPAIGLLVARADLDGAQQRRLRLWQIALLEPGAPFEHEKPCIVLALEQADLDHLERLGNASRLEQSRRQSVRILVAARAETQQPKIEIVGVHGKGLC
jgi:hypothetical protein